MNGVKLNLFIIKVFFFGCSELIIGDGKGFMEDMELSLIKKFLEINRRRREIYRRNFMMWEILFVVMEIN